MTFQRPHEDKNLRIWSGTENFYFFIYGKGRDLRGEGRHRLSIRWMGIRKHRYGGEHILFKTIHFLFQDVCTRKVITQCNNRSRVNAHFRGLPNEPIKKRSFPTEMEKSVTIGLTEAVL